MRASRSSTELVAGFRINRRLGEQTWEAFQPELDRRVALRRIDPGTPFDVTAWPEGPGVVELFAVVEEPGGTYVATRLVPGARTLAELRDVPAGRRRRWVDEAAAALDGVVHGRLTEDDVLVAADGRVLVTGFGRAAEGASGADDRAVLDRLRPPRSRRRLALAALVATAAVALAVALLVGGGEDAPPVTAGAAAVGSALAAGEVATVDCEGAPPSGSSVPCTIMQTGLAGRPLVRSSDGLVRAWAVRGVSGPVALQVVRPDGDGFATYNRSDVVTIDDPTTTTVIRADLSVPKGARFALEVAPGGAVGIRRGVRGATTTRFFGPLRSERRSPDTARGEGEELLLRVDVIARG